MLLVVSPNLAIDRILELEQLRVREVQRSGSVITQPGGKGSNVARVFRQLGGEVNLLGFAGRRNSEWIRDPLEALGIQVEAIHGYEGESRVCTVILETGSTHHPTVINEESRPIQARAVEQLETRFDQLLAQADFVFLTGSLSQGLSVDFYAQLIHKAGSKGIPTAIDATGAALRYALEARPTLAKANLEEMSSALGPLGTRISEVSAAIRRRGGQVASETIVTLGESGAILISDEKVWQATPPRVSHVNPIGTGDAFAAAYIKAWLDGSAIDQALRFATAVAASDAATPEPGLIVPAEISSLVSHTGLVQIHLG